MLEGRIAIVTGAGGGLGRAHALFLASKGAKVVVNDLSADAAKAVAAEIEGSGGTAVPCPGSVTDQAAVGEMVRSATERWARIDILVNNAGILRDKSFTNMAIEDFRAVLDVHLMGSVICTKAVWPIMREQQFGRIVFTTSSSGLWGNFGQANYGAAKMALVGLMQTLGIEGEKYDIRVNCLAPTAATAMTRGILPDESLDVLAPEKVSPGLLALVSEDSPTRAILCAGAGHFARANVTFTDGAQIGDGPGAAEAVISQWQTISDRSGEIVPAYGFAQAEREVASAVSVAARTNFTSEPSRTA
jgi:NAD(P)-dependent dehydrogenase (short-subunit alcohol dehydrogenase family)